MLCSFAKELYQNSKASSREEYIPQILTVLLQIPHVYIWLCSLAFSFCPSFLTIAKTMQLLRRPISVYDRIPDDFTSSVWNFCRWLADGPPRETSRRWRARRNSCFGRLYFYLSVRYKLVINEPLQGETCHPATVIWRTLGRYGTNTGHGSKIYLDVFSVSILHRHPTGISI